MAQAKITDNVYFQQCGDECVEGVFVNRSFITLRVDRELTEEELTELGSKAYDLCMSFEATRTVVNSIKKGYEDGTINDGTIFICG